MKRSIGILTIFFMSLAASAVAFAHENGAGGGFHQNHQGMAMERNMVLPHIVLGGGYETELVFMNPGTGRGVRGTLHFYTQDGTPMNVEYAGQSRMSVSINIPESGSMSMSVGDPNADTRMGWAVFINADDQPNMDDDNLYMGDHLFSGMFYKSFGGDGNRIDTQVGVMGMRFMSGAGMGYSMLVRNDDHNITGFAVVNTSDEEMTATLTMKNLDGSTFAERDLTLQAGHQRVNTLGGFFSGVADISSFDGTMEIRADREGMVPLGLVNTDGIQTAIPMVMIPDSLDHDQVGPGTGMGGGMMQNFNRTQ